MIGPYFDGGRVLDLFSGSGGLSIEAVSRGMSSAVLVERDRKAQAIIQENIKMTKAEQQFTLLKMEAERAIHQLSGQFDLIFWILLMLRKLLSLTLKLWLPMSY